VIPRGRGCQTIDVRTTIEAADHSMDMLGSTMPQVMTGASPVMELRNGDMTAGFKGKSGIGVPMRESTDTSRLRGA
jgi:hypothetical protein